MIETKDQEELFKLIADYLEEDIICIGIGGTAMMFSGYKTTTKDIDLVFENKKDRDVFIKAIKNLGYTQIAIRFVYDEKRRLNKNKPLIYSRGEERFDLFVEDVFGFKLDFKQEGISKRYDFIGKKEFIIYTLPKEYLVLLKSVTSRERDYEDIETIAKIEKEFDWEVIIEEAIKQRKNNEWILIDLEEKMQKLKKIMFIKQKYFQRLYKAEEDAQKRG